MKNLKSFIIYGILIFFCIVALIGYFFSKSPGNISTVTYNNRMNSNKSGVKSSLPANVIARIKKTALIPNPHPIVGIARGDNYSRETRLAVENAGGLKNLIKKGATVLIKPNICIATESGTAAITDYRVVKEIVSIVRECGASKIVIMEGPITGTVFDPVSIGMNGYSNINSVEFIEVNNLNKEDCYEITPNKSLTGKAFYIPKVYLDADFIISVPKLKTHFQPDALVSLSLKNIFGATSGKIYGAGYRSDLHIMGLKEAIVDLNKIRKPDFIVIDGIIGGEGYGPLNNIPVKSNIIFAGDDPVAVDTVALTFMGFTVAEIPHVKLAADKKLGIADLNQIKIIGADLNQIKMKFQRP